MFCTFINLTALNVDHAILLRTEKSWMLSYIYYLNDSLVLSPQVGSIKYREFKGIYIHIKINPYSSEINSFEMINYFI